MKFTAILASILASVAMATCPANVGIQACKELAGNLINAINTGNLALINGSILADNATINLNVWSGATGQCVQNNNLSFFEWAPMAIASGLKFTEATITEAYLTHVGYTVVVMNTVDNKGAQMTHQFNFYAPNGDCNMKLLFQGVTDSRC
jgi:hypothetical protein